MEFSVKQASPAVVLAIIIGSYLMMLIDVSIVITGLPTIKRELQFTSAGLSWVQNAYTLSFGCLLMLGARAGDVLGRRRMFIVGLALFTLASFAIGMAQSPTWLVVARAVQGMGAAVLAPSTLALLSIHFAEGPERTRAFAWYAAAAGVGASFGLVLGGVLADLSSWRVGFFINVPIGVALMYCAKRYLAETSKHAGLQLDVLGALTSTLGMGALVYGIVRSAEEGWSDPVTLIALFAAAILLAAFVVVEARANQPIMPLRLFSSRSRNGAYAARLLFLAGMVGFWFYTTQYLQGVLGMRPLQAGIAFLPATLVNFVSAMSVPRLTKRFGNAWVLSGGLLLSMGGMFWLGQIGPDTSYFLGVALPMVLIGAGQGATLGPLTVAGVAGVSHEDAGAGSGLVNVAHQIGGTLGLGLLVVVAAATDSPTGTPHIVLAHQIASALTASAVLLAAAFAAAFFFIVRQPRHLA